MSGVLTLEKRALLLLQRKKKAAEAAGRGAAIPRRGSSGPAPLSFSQLRLWLLDRLEPGNTAYNIPSLARLRGSLDVHALERSVGEIVRRHDSLRTTFAESDGEPVQGVAPPGSFTLPMADLSGLPDDSRRADERRLLDGSRPFDLEHGPLFRMLLVRLDAETHLLLLDVHHIVSDGWSYGVFFRELAALYGSLREGRAPELPEPPIQYADYAVWQREWLQGTVLEEHLAYWRERLAGAPPALELPTDRGRPAMLSHRGGVVSLVIPGELAASLRELSRREESSLFMTVLAAFQLLLSRLSGQEDVVVGSPSAGRNRVEIEGLIGLLLNTLVLRTDSSGAPTFRELLGRVKEVVLGAYRYQSIPFERLLEELQPERQLSQTPIFQVLFNFVSLSNLEMKLAGLRVEPIEPLHADSKFDFTLYVNDRPETLQLDLVYSTDLYDKARMHEMLRQYVHLLAQAAESPETPVSALSLVTPAALALLPDPAQPLGDEGFGAIQHALS
ncbi:MAG TPA: condensation domain-containing protein, partial [Thermoanaerobaculia bacterium]|nr:condensation domain-containing protein [Thermoanaerobaculia bacterium]